MLTTSGGVFSLLLETYYPPIPFFKYLREQSLINRLEAQRGCNSCSPDPAFRTVYEYTEHAGRPVKAHTGVLHTQVCPVSV